MSESRKLSYLTGLIFSESDHPKAKIFRSAGLFDTFGSPYMKVELFFYENLEPRVFEIWGEGTQENPYSILEIVETFGEEDWKSLENRELADLLELLYRDLGDYPNEVYFYNSDMKLHSVMFTCKKDNAVEMRIVSYQE